MAFMEPQYADTCMWVASTTHGDEPIPQDLVGSQPTWPAAFEDYLEGDPIASDAPDLMCGWWARLSAPGYMDSTPWAGPFDTIEEAMEHIRETYDVDPETGEELEDEGSSGTLPPSNGTYKDVAARRRRGLLKKAIE